MRVQGTDAERTETGVPDKLWRRTTGIPMCPACPGLNGTELGPRGLCVDIQMTPQPASMPMVHTEPFNRTSAMCLHGHSCPHDGMLPERGGERTTPSSLRNVYSHEWRSYWIRLRTKNGGLSPIQCQLLSRARRRSALRPGFGPGMTYY